MERELKHIAEINSGYLFTKRVENDPLGNCRFIQLRDIDWQCCINVEKLMKVSLRNVKKDSFLCKYDILFKAKSSNNLACVVTNKFDSLVASAHFLIIRVKIDSVMPEYLAWYINQKPAQRYFELHSAGSTVSVVTKKILSALNVKILPMEQQKNIIELAKFRMKEQQLEGKITELKMKIYNQKILTLIK